MPFYDLLCEKCNKEFNIRATMTDKTEGRIPCPDCGTTGLKTLYKSAPLYLKSAASDNACPNCDFCDSCPSKIS